MGHIGRELDMSGLREDGEEKIPVMANERKILSDGLKPRAQLPSYSADWLTACTIDVAEHTV